MSEHKFIKRLKLLNNYWTRNPFNIKSFQENNIKPIQLKALIKYSFDTEVVEGKRFVSEQPTCLSKEECQTKINKHKELFLNNKDKEFLEIISQQAKDRKPNLKDKWTSIRREETYIEDCRTCKAKGKVTCKTCSNCSGFPTGNVKCYNCSGSGHVFCINCAGAGGSNNYKSCFTCQGSGKNKCDNCLGNGCLVCSDCYGDSEITCPDCEGQKEFIHSEEINLNVLSETVISWDKENTIEWVNYYIGKELSEEPTHISLMTNSNWHSHTFNVANFEKEQYFASIQGNIESFQITYIDNDKKEFNCKYIHKNLIPYDMDYIFDDYIEQICDDFINKNNFKYQKIFFKNKIIENIVNEKGEQIPFKSKIISVETKNKISNTFNDFAKENIEEQRNINIINIFNWTTITFLVITLSLIFIQSFSQQNINFQLISIPNIILNISESLSSLLPYLKNYSLHSILFLSSSLTLSFILRKFLGSSKKSILRHVSWFINTTIFCYLIFFNLHTEFDNINWLFSFNNLIPSLYSIKYYFIDILLFSSLIGILKSRNINCFKLKKIANFLKNNTLKKKLGY
jgi:hypothetical protein